MSEKKVYEPKWMKARSTHQARRAIADFVNDNADNLSDWLHRVAYGVPKIDRDGAVIYDAQGSIVYLLKPDPGAAIKAVADIAEYHLPKLSRSDVAMVATVENSASLSLVERVQTMSTSEIKRALANSVQDVESRPLPDTVEPEPLPAWMQPPTSDT